MRSTKLNVICPSCGSKKFRQEVTEISYRYLDGRGLVLEFECDLTHDFEFGTIRCLKCGRDCDDIFESIEIYLLDI